MTTPKYPEAFETLVNAISFFITEIETTGAPVDYHDNITSLARAIHEAGFNSDAHKDWLDAETLLRLLFTNYTTQRVLTDLLVSWGFPQDVLASFRPEPTERSIILNIRPADIPAALISEAEEESPLSFAKLLPILVSIVEEYAKEELLPVSLAVTPKAKAPTKPKGKSKSAPSKKPAKAPAKPKAKKSK